MTFRNPFNYVHDNPEVNSGEIVVDKSGYVPAQRIIESFIYSGRQLQALRASGAQYDYPNGDVPEDAVADEYDEDLSDLTSMTNELLRTSKTESRDGEAILKTEPEPAEKVEESTDKTE